MALSGRLIEHGHGLVDVSLSSYNRLVRQDIPQMIDDMRPIVWSGRTADGRALSVLVKLRFASIQKPMLTENQPQILLPMQAQQLGRSYNGRLLVNVEIGIKLSTPEEGVHRHDADIRDLCVGEIPVLVGSVMCHQPPAPGRNVAYFIVNGQNKVIVSRPGAPRDACGAPASRSACSTTIRSCPRAPSRASNLGVFVSRREGTDPRSSTRARCVPCRRRTPTAFRWCSPCA